MTIDATNGTVLETSVEDDEDEFEDLRALNLRELRSATDAVAIAQNETAGTVTEVELRTDEGLPIYEVEVVADDGTETTVYVAATEGPVLGIHTEGNGNESDG
ncbi:PepSY domain-containing protein [Halopelagius fulvigenes]|uniref:PepSY domain-containing protein n=1 Tax=Halopelagius fulvigenes TaxID=1198324 RepID=A0ABD5TTB9_9EURY